MEQLKSLLMGLWSDEEGATVVEYAVMLALIILVAIGAIIAIGNEVNDAFDRVSAEIQSAK